MAKHAVVRTDNMLGVDARSELISIKYLGADGETPTAIDNGNVLKDNGLVEGEREIRIGGAVTSSDALRDVVLIATPEVMYDEHLKNLDDYYNEEGKICRGYRFHSGDIFSVTADALEGTPEVGEEVTLADGTKLEVGGSGTAVGKIIDHNITSRYEYWVIEVE